MSPALKSLSESNSEKSMLTQLLDVFSFASVLLRGGTLAFQPPIVVWSHIGSWTN
jgi:hypothetical protein